MGAKKKRQGECWPEHPPGCGDPGTITPGSVPGGGGTSESVCCNSSSSYTDENNNVVEQKPGEELKCEDGKDEDRRSSKSLFTHAWRKLVGSKRKKSHNSSLLVIGLLVVASSNLVYRPVDCVCVWQGGGGFRVACGFRQSGLFRIRSIGGIKGYIGGGFTIGDEDGFKDSLTNTEGGQTQTGAYIIPNNAHSQRSLPTGQGFIGQYSSIQEHALIPTGDPEQQRQQKFQYLQNLQHQLDTDHTELQLQAQDQQSQKQLEQQMYIQGGMPPAPTPKVKRAETGGLTKRASLWNWNIFGRGKNGKNAKNGKKKPNKNGPPQQPQNRRGGPPHPPPPNKQNRPTGNGRWDKRGRKRPPPPPPPRNKQRGPGPGPLAQGGIAFPKSPKELKNMAENFLGHMKNPFSHLQENFVGKNSNSKEVRKINYQQEQNPHFQMAQRKQLTHTQSEQRHEQQIPQPLPFPPFPQMSFPPSSMEKMRQVPQQNMLPPPPSSLHPMDVPKFKEFPDTQKAQDRQDDYVEEEYDDGPPHTVLENQQQQPPIDRMMEDVNEHDDYPQDPPPPHEFYRIAASQEAPQYQEQGNDPAGLKMLKRTENFGTIFHLVNPDGSPVNMQFEKQPVLPPDIQFSSQQQQDLAEELAKAGFGFPQEVNQQPPPPNMNDILNFGQMDMDSPLATAVYDPNVFPDIYFTTTEKHKNSLGGSSADVGGGNGYLSQELLDNPHTLLGGNHLKRVLGSSEKSDGKMSRDELIKKVLEHQKSSGEVQRSSEVAQGGGDDQGQIVLVPTRRKVRRKKKFRQQMSNMIDTTESDSDVSSSTPSSKPKRRRKGRRKKKYKLATTRKKDEPSSTERMGIAVDGGEQTSSENVAKTENPRLEPLTTTPAPEKQALRGNPPEAKPENKTSFSLPSTEDLTGPSAENKVDTSAQTTTRKSSTEDSTTKVPISYSTFGYIDALRNRQGSPDDYDFSGPGADDFYDPRYPPDHEVNRGRNMTKFIRPRRPPVPVSRTTSTTFPDTTNMPFILYDMVGTRNQSRFSSKFQKEVSPFTLDADLEQNQENQNEVERRGNAGNQYHPFYTNNVHKPSEDVFLKFDSREWANGHHHQNNYHKESASDPFAHHYNRTSSFTSGYYGDTQNTDYGPSAELPWHRRYDNGMDSTTPPPTPIYPVGYGSNEQKKFFNGQSASVEHGLFGPTMETFGLPKKTTKLPYDSSGEKRKLHKNLFGGSSDDVSDLGNWASPNFWGNVQDTDRYSPNADFDQQNNMRRVSEFGDANGLKEVTPGDLSKPTPLPVPAPAPSLNTMEDLMDDILSPAHPGGRWGKQRRRKQRPSSTLPPPTTPAPTAVPLVMSTAIVTSVPASQSTTQAPPKWLAVTSNEIDIPAKFTGPPTKEKGMKSGVEIKFRSGEERDPEEEENQEEKLDLTLVSTANATNKMGVGLHGSYPGVMVHDYDSSRGYGYGENQNQQQYPQHQDQQLHYPNQEHNPPRGHSSEINYYPHGSVGGGVHGASKSGEVSVMNVYPPTQNQYDLAHPPPSRNQSPKEFNPSAEDLGPLQLPEKGMPSHKDNPFKQFEKHDVSVNEPNIGFVSPKHEFNEMVNQIQKLVPDEFLRRDSAEKQKPSGSSFRKARLGGLRSFRRPRVLMHKHRTEAFHKHLSIPRKDQPELPGKHGRPPPPVKAGDMNLPGFVNIPLSVDPSPSEIPMKNNPVSPLEFGPSGFPNNLRSPESGQQGAERYPPGPKDQRPGPSHMPGYLGGPQEAVWDLKPIDNNEVNDLGPQYTHDRHPPPGRHRLPPPHERDRPHHYQDGPPRPSLSQIMHSSVRDEHEGPRSPPPSRPPPPPPPHRDERPMRPPPPPPPHRDERPMRPPPPPPHRDERPMRPPPPPPHRDERPRPPHPPPPHDHGRHDFPPRGPPGPPGHHDRRPPPEFEREFHPPRRDDGHHPRRDEGHPPRRDEGHPPRRDEGHPPRRDDHPPRRDEGHPPRRDDGHPPRRDEGHPPRHGPPEDRFRDGPPRGPPPPPPHAARGPDPLPPGDKFYPPRKEDSIRFDHDRKNFHDDHKIEHLRPPHPQFHDRGHEHHGDHSNYGKWRDDKHDPRHHGPPDYMDQKKSHHPEHLRPPPPPPPKSSKSHNPFLHKPPPPPPPPPGKAHNPNQFANIPVQMFKPPPPPPNTKPPNYYPNPPNNVPHMPPPNSRGPPPSNSRPPPPSPNPPTRKPPVPVLDHGGPDPFHKNPFRDPPRDRDHLPHNTPNNYINSYNDRYDPPPPQRKSSQDTPSSTQLRPPPPPPMHPHPDQTGGGSRLPYLPFPVPGGAGFESSVIDLDQDPHPHLLPPTMLPHEDPTLPHRSQKLPPAQPTRPVYRPPNKPKQTADSKMDEKSKLLDAFETLNKANYDVIQSLAAEKYGPELIDRVKTKSNIIKPEPKPAPLPLKVEALPVVTSTTPDPKPLKNIITANQPTVQEETAKLAELLKMINKQPPSSSQPSPLPIPQASSMPQSQPSDPLSNLIQRLTNQNPTPAPTTPPPTTRRVPEVPSNPGLLSLTSALNPGPTHNVKSLQAQIAKAIIAKAHQKSQIQQPLQMSPPPSDSPLQVLQQLAQNRQSSPGRNNYTASQIETLKKLIALNNIEQKLHQPPAPPTTEDPLRKLQALLPAALSAAAAKQKQQQISSNTISRKMLDSSSSSLASQHNSNLLQKLNAPDPTILALKAIALSKAQGVHPQPSISFPQQAKPTEASSQPISVDLSSILSPSPPVVEASRKRRLTNVRNAPKSFFPANATQGFEDFAFPLLTEFTCDAQNFFPGLYADTELGCRVFHLCAKTEAGYMMKSFRCPKETVFDQEVLRCNWNLFVDCPKSRNKYHFNKYLSQSFQFLKILGEFSANIQKSDATMTG